MKNSLLAVSRKVHSHPKPISKRFRLSEKKFKNQYFFTKLHFWAATTKFPEKKIDANILLLAQTLAQTLAQSLCTGNCNNVGCTIGGASISNFEFPTF